jgi:hypothetical protein
MPMIIPIGAEIENKLRQRTIYLKVKPALEKVPPREIAAAPL